MAERDNFASRRFGLAVAFGPVANRWTVNFGSAGGLGVAVASAAMAPATWTFRWEGFASTEDLVNHIVGGLLLVYAHWTARSERA